MPLQINVLKNEKVKRNKEDLMEISFPNFIIVGAPKAGTTSLYNYLAQHPSIFMSKRKEPVFFCGYTPNFTGPGSRAFNRDLITSDIEYKKLFEGTTDKMITGEASTDYLSCPEAPLRIQAWNPDAKIIIILRNPIDRAYSEHMHLVRDRHENSTFMESLKLEKERIDNGFIPLFWHVKRGLYFESTKRYLDIFSPSRVKVFLYDNFFNNLDETVKDVFRFIGVKPIPIDTSKRMNISGVPRWGMLQELYREYRCADSDSIVKKIARLFSTSTIRRKIQSFYLHGNINRSEKIRDEEREYLCRLFKPDIERLGELLEVDLTHWLTETDQSDHVVFANI